MSILIKGMKMPKDCVSCRWHTRWGCEITGIVTNAAQSCPLVEVPPHGRLIDADALKRLIGSYDPIKYTYEYGFVITVADIDNAPTIIEAEEGEDNE